MAFVGTPRTIADEMEQWLAEEGSDGFNIMFQWLHGGLDDFVDRVVPEFSPAICSGASMKGRHCAIIWGCGGRPTGSSQSDFSARSMNEPDYIGYIRDIALRTVAI